MKNLGLAIALTFFTLSTVRAEKNWNAQISNGELRVNFWGDACNVYTPIVRTNACQTGVLLNHQITCAIGLGYVSTKKRCADSVLTVRGLRVDLATVPMIPEVSQLVLHFKGDMEILPLERE